MSKHLFKAGDTVKVYSLQSWDGGGFLHGADGIVSQDQGTGSSVLVSVARNLNGVMRVDPDYEVYAEQLELVSRPNNKGAVLEFTDLVRRLREGA